jgi:hypothetical protein
MTCQDDLLEFRAAMEKIRKGPLSKTTDKGEASKRKLRGESQISINPKFP